MGYMNFKEPALEKLFKNFKWSRNNTIQLFEEAQNNNILNYKSSSIEEKSNYIFQPLVFQFQCIISTTDTYYRKLTANKNQNFGVLIIADKIIPKEDINVNEIRNILTEQLVKLERLLQNFDSKKMEENIDLLQTISNHEYLHQGQMIIDFREAGKDLPERFRKAWAL